MILSESAKKYSSRRYGCPYCDYAATREELVKHIERKHEDMIPEGYTAARIVFNKINKKEYGTCVVCGKETEWNEKHWKYNRVCNNPECKAKIREKYTTNMNNAGKDPNTANDPDHQTKMLAGRKISGEYKFTDGGKHSYTGSYEKRRLEFMDKVMGYKSWEVVTPGPTIYYDFNGERHFWITDCYIIPSNLVIDDKDGGDNPNSRPMKDYREKQIAKEKAIADLGTYNYLRLTNTDFSQLMYAVADIKSKMVDNYEEVSIYINEDASAAIGAAFPNSYRSDAYIVPFTMGNSFGGEEHYIGMTKSIDDNLIYVDKEGKLKKKKSKHVLFGYPNSIYEVSVSLEDLKRILEAYETQETVDKAFLYETVTHKKLYDMDQLAFDPLLSDMSRIKNAIYGIAEATTRMEANRAVNGTDFSIPLITNEEINKANTLVGESGLEVKQDPRGYFLYNPESDRRSLSYNDIDRIPRILRNFI